MMRQSVFCAALLSASCLGTIGSASAQTIYTDRAAFLAATTNQTVTDFEDATLDPSRSEFYGRSRTFNGFSVSNNEFMFANSPSNRSYNFNSGNVLSVNDGVGSFTIGSGFSAFGFDFGKNPGGNVPLNVVINDTSYQIQPFVLSFFGIVGSTGLSPISFRTNGGIGVFDNITTATAAAVVTPDPVNGAVPEPATWAMMILGFGAVGSAMRRHRARTRVRFA